MESVTCGAPSISAIWLSTPVRMARPVGRVTRLLNSEVTLRRCTRVRSMESEEPRAGCISAFGDGHAVHAVAPLQLADHVQPLRHLTEDGVHAVQVPRVLLVEDDEE